MPNRATDEEHAEPGKRALPGHGERGDQPRGEPVEWLVQVREAGFAVACQVGNAADLAAAAAAGADVVVARGGEGGGHGRNEMATEEILALALQETDRPVLAAGGIADAADVSRVMAAGASGVACGIVR